MLDNNQDNSKAASRDTGWDAGWINSQERFPMTRKALLTANRQIANGIFAMDLDDPALAAASSPGRFVMVAVNDGHDPFLRRPFSIAGIDKEAGRIRLIYQLVGKGTDRMSQWETGRQVDILGPLGKGFSWGNEPETAILVGGGMGIAPLLPLAEELRRQGKEVSAFLGARTMDLLFGQSLFGKYGCDVRLATEDGSAGYCGFITTPLEEFLATHHSHRSGDPRERDGDEHRPSKLFACGPTPFLKVIAGLYQRFSIDIQLSLEERMGCGFGVCMGCSIETKTTGDGVTRQRVCCDGPVFSAGEVVFHG